MTPARILILLFAAFAVAGAQPRNAVLPWWENPLASGLELTTPQRGQIREVLREYRNRLVDARAAVDKAENDLEDVFNEPSVDRRRGDEAIARLAGARAELTKAVSEMSLRLRAILTAEQWQELQKRSAEPDPGNRRRAVPKNVTEKAPRSKMTVSKN